MQCTQEQLRVPRRHRAITTRSSVRARSTALHCTAAAQGEPRRRVQWDPRRLPVATGAATVAPGYTSRARCVWGYMYAQSEQPRPPHVCLSGGTAHFSRSAQRALDVTGRGPRLLLVPWPSRALWPSAACGGARNSAGVWRTHAKHAELIVLHECGRLRMVTRIQLYLCGRGVTAAASC